MVGERFQLAEPFHASRSQRERLGGNGIFFDDKTERGFGELYSPFSLSAADFGSLSKEDLYYLYEGVRNPDLEGLLATSVRIQTLLEQATIVHDDDFVYPAIERPFTWPLREQIPVEVDHLLSKLREHGIDEVKVGLELEFTCPKDAVEGFTHWQQVKEAILGQLRTLQKDKGYGDERDILQKKVDMVETFNAREVMMYDVIELDPRTRDVLEPLFGTSRDGDGYYDARGVLELKLTPVDLIQVMKNRRAVLDAFYNKSVEYGLEINHTPNFQVNVSFWDEEGNLLSDDHQAFEVRGKVIAEGITRAFYDAIPVLNAKAKDSENLGGFNLSVDREGYLRFSSERIEVRPLDMGHEQDVDMILTVLLCGVNYGLSLKGKSDMLPASEVVVPVVHHEEGKFKVLAHVLSNSIIGSNGTLTIPDGYIHVQAEELAYELGLISEVTGSAVLTLIRLFGDFKFLPYINEFIQSISVSRLDGPAQLDFPETSGGIYEFVIPAKNIDKMPVNLQRRLEGGESLSKEEMESYLEADDERPLPAEKCAIDVWRLQESLSLVGLRRKFVVTGYDLNDTSGLVETSGVQNQVLEARRQRLLQSVCLQQGLSPDFFGSFCELFGAQYGSRKVESGLGEVEVDKEEVVRRLHYSFEDEDWRLEELPEEVVSVWEKLVAVVGGNGSLLAKYYTTIFKAVGEGDSFTETMRRVIEGLVADSGSLGGFEVIKHSYISPKRDEVEVRAALEFFDVLKTKFVES